MLLVSGQSSIMKNKAWRAECMVKRGKRLGKGKGKIKKEKGGGDLTEVKRHTAAEKSQKKVIIYLYTRCVKWTFSNRITTGNARKKAGSDCHSERERRIPLHEQLPFAGDSSLRSE
ncbi:MAG: hypothetical protein P8Y60_14060 [Calditrichota bacterium]